MEFEGKNVDQAVFKAAQELGRAPEDLEYVVLERRPRPIPGVHPLAAAGVPLKGVVGCFLSNELLDSFPVHRIAVQGGRLQEVYVTWQEGFREVLGPPSTPLLEQYLEEEGVALPEGYRTEINLEAGRWQEGVAGALERGFVITIDYGYAPGEYFSPAHSQGTLLCYYRHTYHQDPYVRVGEQDITAHVDFGSLIRAGERAGLSNLGLVPQARFLNNLGLGYLRERLARAGLSQREYLANSLALGQLVKPGGLGDFLVLLQGQGIPEIDLWGLKPSPESREFLESLPLPLLTPQHLSLLEARYPHMLSLPDALAGGYPDS